MKLCLLGLAIASTLLVTGCSAAAEDPVGATHDEITSGGSFVARGTGYYPDGSALEGGFVDRRGKPLRTLQQYLAGKADYVSVAMDTTAFAYGQRLRINELEREYGRTIVFRVVDTGGAFRGKGRTRIDVCTASSKASVDPTINGSLHIDVMNETTTNDPAPIPPAADAPAPSGGAACHTHGDCNPGNDGSGQICVSGQCVDGCTASWQCPGSTTCVSGQCR